MQTHKVRVTVTLKLGVLDPQGLAIKQVIDTLGNCKMVEVRQGKIFDMILEAESPQAALATATELGKTVLSNPILETFTCALQ